MMRWARGRGLAVTALTLLACNRHSAGLPATPAAAEAEMKTALDRSTVAPGDTFTLTVSIEHSPDVDIQLDPPGSSLDGFSLATDAGIQSASGHDASRDSHGRSREVYWYRLQAQTAGSYVLAAPPATYRSSHSSAPQPLKAPDLYLEVTAAPPDTHLHDIKPLQPAARWAWVWLAAGVVGLLGAAAGVWWWWRRRRRRAHVMSAPLPHQVALQALQALQQPDAADRAAVRRYHFAISEILRAYVEARFHVNATDLTTEEILARLPHLVDLQADEQARLREFLADTDRVKFAGYAASADEIAQSHARALRFVEATHMLPAAPPASA